MTDLIPKGNLTAWQRWEMAAFDEAEQAAERAAEAAAQQAAQQLAAEQAARQAAAKHEAQQAAAKQVAQQTEPEGVPAPEPEAVMENIEAQVEPVIVLPTAAEIEQMHADAHKEGYDAGYAEGAARAGEIVERLNALMGGLQASLGALDQEVAEQLLATSVEIASQMLCQSLRVKPELLLPVVREAIDALYPLSGSPMLYVHPDDAELIHTHLGEPLEHKNWRIVEDPGLSPGGCRIEHGGSEVDATRETRWRRVIEAMGISEAWLEGKP